MGLARYSQVRHQQIEVNMQKSALSVLFSVLLLCCFNKTVFADAAQDLVTALKKIETFQANFTQKIRDGSGEHISKTQGTVIIQRPDRFYWKSLSPDPILVVADGKF